MKRILFWLFFPVFVHAHTKNYWVCVTQDSHEQRWRAQSTYQRVALNKSIEACKKESMQPETCKNYNENCEFFLIEKGKYPLWQCTAIDENAQPFKSNVHSTMDEAALAAKNECEQRSLRPESCSINMATCQNLNER